MRQPKWKEHFRVERLEPDLVFLLSEKEQHVLTGTTYYEMSPLLDGTYTSTDITKQMNEGTSFLDVSQALVRLKKKGYIFEAEDTLPQDLAVLAHSLGVEPKAAKQRLATKQIAVIDLSRMNVTSLTEKLTHMGIQVITAVEQSDLCVVITDDYLNPELAQLNQTFLAQKQPWLLLRPAGTLLHVGPLFQADLTGCWDCLSNRLKIHRRVESFLQTKLPHLYETPITFPLSMLSPLTNMGIDWAAIEILKWVLQGHNEELNNNLITIDIYPFQLEKHAFVKRPQCPHCGNSDLVSERMQQPLKLQSQPKQFTIDGGHRIMPPEETVAKYAHHVSLQIGVIGWLKPTHKSEEHRLIYTYSSGISVKFIPTTIKGLISKMKGGDAGGKGASLNQAKASGLCEAIERYSASFQGDEYTITSSFKALGDRAIHPNECMNYSERQYQQSLEWNSSPTSNHTTRVPARFDESAEIQWTPIWSLTEQTTKYLPTTYCYYGNTPDMAVSQYAPADSNGNAAGNTLEEAILQGFMELIERDCIGIWWYNRLQCPEVNMGSFNNPYLTELKDYYNSLNRDLWVIDISNDLGVPVFAGVSRRIDGDREDIIYGFGAHFDPHIALLRAVTEVSQSLSIFLSQDNYTTLPSFNDKAESWWQTATIENQPYLLPKKNVPPRTPSDFPKQWSDDLLDDVMHCVEVVKRQGLETLVLDQTQPDIGLNVVKVFVPGLCHDWRRLGQGRLYDVPVKLGWLDTPLKEKNLNPFTIYL